MAGLRVIKLHRLVKTYQCCITKRTLVTSHFVRYSSKEVKSGKLKANTTSVAVMARPDKTDPDSSGHYDRNFITAMRAMQDFLLKPEHLEGLRVTSRRSPNEADPPIKVYWRKDVEARSIQVWGSHAALEAEIEKRETHKRDRQMEFVSFYRKLISSSDKASAGGGKKRKRKLARESWPVRPLRPGEGGLKSESGRVVLTAIGINTANCLAKGIAWVMTGSHAMFSETVHSAADTINQVILAYGLKKSTKQANEDHPYGYSQMQYVTSLISAVGIFCMGAGLSIYHGVTGLQSPTELHSMTTAAVVLGGSFVSESFTLVLAVKSIRQSAQNANMGFLEYVAGGYDPCVNVVLLEDSAAVLGVVIAGGAMGLSIQLGSHIPDALGSIMIGALLGSVASFMIHTNSAALVGRSIPEERIQEINEGLEGDIMVRQLHDVKGIDMGNGIVRYKAEVDVDGRELARYYLTKRDLDQMMDEVLGIKTQEDLERFVLKHGENIVDCLGEQVDRIEKELKKKHPDVRHVDLEVL